MKHLIFIFMLLTSTVKAQIDFKLENFYLEGVELYSKNGNQIDVGSINNVFSDFSEITDTKIWYLTMSKYTQLVKKLTIGVYIIEENVNDEIEEHNFYLYKDEIGSFYILNHQKIYINQVIPDSYLYKKQIKSKRL